MKFKGVAYRAHDPKWSFSPLSGVGAALSGGRFNPKGMEALYLAVDPIGAMLEVAQGLLERLEPLTLCQYDIDVDDMVDLTTTSSRSAAGTSLSELSCAWKLSAAPPSHALARRLYGEGAAGIVVPSFAPKAQPRHVNLILWRWGPELPHRVSVFDPSGRLPKNQLSWS